MSDLSIVRVVDNPPELSDLKDNEDFMPVSLWNQAAVDCNTTSII